MFSPFSTIRRKVQILVNRSLDQAEKEYLEKIDKIDQEVDERYEKVDSSFSEGLKALTENRRKEIINIEVTRDEQTRDLNEEVISQVLNTSIHQ